jgi:uncharacterized protein YkwD
LGKDKAFDVALGTTSVSVEMAAEISLLRANPAEYSKYLEDHLTRFVTEKAYSFTSNPAIRYNTEEGKLAVQEAIDELKKTEPMCPLSSSVLLERACADHVNDMAAHPGMLGHTGTDGSQARDRIDRYGKFEVSCGENISYGMNIPREIVMQLLIDDAVPGRGHRKILLEPLFRIVGASFGPHSQYGCVCVLDFAAGIKDFADMPSCDTVVDCPAGGDLSPEVVKIIRSFTSAEQSVELISNLLERLGSGTNVKVTYKHAEKTCEIGFDGREFNVYTWE